MTYMNASAASSPLSFIAQVWVYPGEHASWYFCTVPKAVAVHVRSQKRAPARGFGSVRVEVTIGATTWQTSLFPDKVSQSYLLPLKATVRRAEDIWEGERIQVTFRMVQ